MLTEQPLIPFDRLWGEEGTDFNLADGGFLVDPTSDSPLADPDLKMLHSYDKCQCLILLGEMGSGKSSELARFMSPPEINSATRRLFDLGAYDKESLNQIFEDSGIHNAKDSGDLLYLLLDSFDEGLLEVNVLSDRLYRGLTSIQYDQLRVRIACRGGIWSSTSEQKIRSIWPDLKVLRLAPLRRRDATEMASARGVPDPAKFLARVAASGATAFATRPGTLRFLISSFLSNGPSRSPKLSFMMKAAAGFAPRNQRGLKGGTLDTCSRNSGYRSRAELRL